MPIFSPFERGLWKRYFALLDGLRDYAVWQHEEDGQLHEHGWRQKPPRFVAVIEHQSNFIRTQALADELNVLRTPYPIQMFDEVWGWGRVQINEANSSARYKSGAFLNLGPVEKYQEEQAREVVAALLVAGHRASLEKGKNSKELHVTAGPGGLTARWSSGRAFRLRAWSPQGELLHDKLSVGTVVCRGVKQGIEDGSDRPRKARADKLPRLTAWGNYRLYQPQPMLTNT